MNKFSFEYAPNKILLGGQSNMDGCGKMEELPNACKTHPENTLTWYNKKKRWMLLGEDSFSESREYLFGPEIAFSHQLEKAFPNYTIAVVKTSEGGTRLWKDWLPEQVMYNRFINTDKLKMLWDNTHFAAKAQIWHGKEMGKIMVSQIK